MEYPNLLKLLDEHLEKYETRQRRAHHPSSASCVLPDGKVIGKCLRAQYYSWQGIEPTNPIKAGQRFKLEAGNAIHDKVAHWIRDMGLQVQEEYPFEATYPTLKYPIHGRIDNVIVFPENNNFFGVEVKSGYSKYFSAPDGVENAGPRKTDLLQVLLYLHFVKDLKAFYLIYFARDNGRRLQFIIDRNSEYFNEMPVEEIIRRWEILEDHLEKKKLPPRDYYIEYPDEVAEKLYEEYLKETKAKKPQSFKAWRKNNKGDWQCSYCPYKDLCKEEKNE